MKQIRNIYIFNRKGRQFHRQAEAAQPAILPGAVREHYNALTGRQAGAQPRGVGFLLGRARRFRNRRAGGERLPRPPGCPGRYGLRWGRRPGAA